MEKEISGHTKLLCLLGSPVEHSISPKMHNTSFSELGLDYKYLAFDVKEDEMIKAVEGLKTLKAVGWNITMPGKNIMAKLCDELSLASQISGACNTVLNKDGKLYGTTTDGIGFMKAVEEYDVNIIGKKMTLLGAGGAATAILTQAAIDGVKEIDVYNVKDSFYDRTIDIVDKLNNKTNCKVTLRDFSNLEDLRKSISESSILVNGTSVGMAPNVDRSIITDLSMLHKDLFVFDVIYNPMETKLIKDAKSLGLKTGNGLYMLLHQGAASFKIWTGQDMPIDFIKKECFKNR